MSCICKKAQGEVPYRSGCDDKDAPNEVQTLLAQELHEIYSAKLEDSNIASRTVVAKNANDFAQLDALLWNASLGMLTPKTCN